MNRIKKYWTFYLVLVVSAPLLESCGYDVASQYDVNPSVGVELKINSKNSQATKAVLVQAFLNEGLSLERIAEYDKVNAQYYISDKASRTSVIMYNSEGYMKLVIGVHPARLSSVSSERKKELKSREEEILRIAKTLRQSDYFSEYIKPTFDE